MAPRRITEFNGPHRWLSNFAPVSVRYNGVLYPTVEHAYQAQKTTAEGWPQVILAQPTAGQAKRMGQKARPLRSDWDLVRVPIMRWLLEEKFEQEPYRTRLVETGDAELIEGNAWGDTFWGVSNGVGENRLGKMLMEIREKLRSAR